VPERFDLDGPSPADVQARLAAARTQRAFLIFRDDRRQQRIVTLDSARELTFGRSPGVDVVLEWDPMVSRVHALLECIGGTWMVSDDRLSSNGTFCNGERVRGRRRLSDGDTLRVGETAILFRAESGSSQNSTVKAPAVRSAKLSDTQRRVLIALCRPYLGDSSFALPATNQDIAAELSLSVDAVKAHLRVLFEKFGIEHLAQNQKRGRLVELAFHTGAITERDLT
jgi:pSer/pThr/pTyr-binding forkhead associated (FHA) protein